MTDTCRTARTPLLDFDPFDPAHRADPYPYYRRLREEAPVYFSPRGHWVLSRHRDCVDVLRDARFGHGTGQLLRKNSFRRPVEGRSLPFIRLDPPEHTRLRSLVSKVFTPRIVERLAPRIQQITTELLDAVIEEGEVDLMAAFAYPLPVAVISELLGVPSKDRDAIKELSHLVARSIDPDFQTSPEEQRRKGEAFARFDGYFRALLAERRRRPTNDLLSKLAAVQDQGTMLSEDELLATCILLYVAGHETTMDLLGNGTLALLRHPGELRRFREDPDLGPSAIEELLRYDPPTQLTARTALADVELDGHRIHQGEQVILIRGAANRDPEVFPDPDRLDLGRRNNRHLSFDGGIHFCLGAALARLEGRIALGTLVHRAPRMELAMDTLRYRENLIIRGLAELRVRLRP
jgi:cytochrome P450